RTLVLRLKQPQPSLLYGLAQGYNPMLPKHLYASDIKRAADKTGKPVGTGPFVFKEYIPGEKVVYTRNPDYWNKPYPYLDGMEARILGSLTAVRTALRGGRVDLDSGPAYMNGASITTLINECNHCTSMPRGDVPSFQFMMVNHQRPPWNTPEVKDAISYALDRTKFAKVASDGWFLPTGILSSGGDGYWSLDKEPWFRQVPGFNFDDPEGNKAKARELLAKAGYKPGELTVDFWTIKDFIPLVTLGEDLNAVGIKATYREVESAAGYAAVGAGDFNLIAWSSGMGSRDPDSIFFDTYYTGTDRNYGRYSNIEADRLMDLQSRTLDPQERRRTAFKAAEVMMKDQATIALGWRMTQPVFSQDVRNWLPVYCGLCSPSGRFERVWLERK
ncbi:MAG: ABC transporter substrate-binding protein, partial [Chloroflexi bacterium]|nr:ABC transporter substrate-binding protein [Chloroflexota bacterium]